MLHNLSISNLIMINFSLLRPQSKGVFVKVRTLGLSFFKISKNLSNVLCYISQCIKDRRTYNSCNIISIIIYIFTNVFLFIKFISFDVTYDGNFNKVVAAESFRIKPFPLNKELKYNLLYNVIRPAAKPATRFLITLFRNFYKDAAIK